jgi:hypothetical protein
MNTKNVLVVAGVATVLLGSLTFAAVSGKTNRPDFSAVKTAVEANNYASLPDTAKTKITEAQFAEMVQKATEHKTVENAITAGDYTAFKNAKIAQIPTEAEFQKIVAEHKDRIASQSAVETAVKNNDFAAFKTAMIAQKVQMGVNHPRPDGDTQAPSDAQLQKHFDKLVAYYKANGKLPDVGGPGLGRMGGEGKMMSGKMGGHGPRGDGKKGE